MSENANPLTPEVVDAMAYNDLKSKAAELGLEATGTKEALQSRIKEHIGGNAPAAPASAQPAEPAAPTAPEAETPAENPQESAPAPQAPVISETEERAETAKADVALRQSAREMKAALEKQPKKSIMIPFEAGENPESGKKVPFHVNLNGYAVDYPRGQYIEVPEQIADIIKERLESEGKIGAQWRIDRDASKVDALA